MKALVIDNYDSFTYNLVDCIRQCGVACDVILHDEWNIAECEQRIGDYQSVIISPGPETPAKAGITTAFIKRFYKQVPILGICLGHQALGECFGAQLQKAAKPMHGKTSEVNHGGHPLFKQIPTTFTVMRYHSLILQQLPADVFEVIAQTPEGEIMAIAHEQFPLMGIQFHPESILTPQGLQMLVNWFEGTA